MSLLACCIEAFVCCVAGAAYVRTSSLQVAVVVGVGMLTGRGHACLGSVRQDVSWERTAEQSTKYSADAEGGKQSTGFPLQDDCGPTAPRLVGFFQVFELLPSEAFSRKTQEKTPRVSPQTTKIKLFATA